jgi:hypothetical protein
LSRGGGTATARIAPCAARGRPCAVSQGTRELWLWLWPCGGSHRTRPAHQKRLLLRSPVRGEARRLRAPRFRRCAVTRRRKRTGAECVRRRGVESSCGVHAAAVVTAAQQLAQRRQHVRRPRHGRQCDARCRCHAVRSNSVRRIAPPVGGAHCGAAYYYDPSSRAARLLVEPVLSTEPVTTAGTERPISSRLDLAPAERARVKGARTPLT